LEQVPFGEYLLLAIRPTFGFGSQGGMLSPDDVLGSARIVVDRDLEDVQISAPQPRALVLSAVSLSPAPAAGCPAIAPVTLVPVQPPGSREPIHARVPLDEPSSVDGVLPGRYRISASLGERCFLASPAQFDVAEDAAPNPVRLEITPGATLQGRIKADGAAGSQFLVVLLPAPQTPPGLARVTQPDASGRFRFENLPPGPYRIALRSAGASARARWFPPLTQTLEVRIAAGSTVETELEPPPPSYR
jgi:hypothetical protein